MTSTGKRVFNLHVKKQKAEKHNQQRLKECGFHQNKKNNIAQIESAIKMLYALSAASAGLNKCMADVDMSGLWLLDIQSICLRLKGIT